MRSTAKSSTKRWPRSAALSAISLNLSPTTIGGSSAPAPTRPARSLFGAREHAADTAGHPDVDAAFAQARTWSKEAHNLQLLTVYEQRIRRAVEKNMAQFKALQTERKEAAKEAMEQAKLLYQFAQAQGKPYRPEAYFITAPEVKESVYSSTEVAREVSRASQLWDAENYAYLGRLPKKDEPGQPKEAAARQ